MDLSLHTKAVKLVCHLLPLHPEDDILVHGSQGMTSIEVAVHFISSGCEITSATFIFDVLSWCKYSGVCTSSSISSVASFGVTSCGTFQQGKALQFCRFNWGDSVLFVLHLVHHTHTHTCLLVKLGLHQVIFNFASQHAVVPAFL